MHGSSFEPPAFQGARVCTDNGFSPLAAILSSQLTAVNALLGVRPDHSDEPRQLTAINPSDGQAYLHAFWKVTPLREVLHRH